MPGTISPYQIAGNLNFQPGGNPVTTSPAGLAMAYGQSYNSALAANSQNYNNILSGYQNVLSGLQQGVSNVGTGYTNLMNGITNTLGANYGVPGVNNQWGVAAPAASAIQKLYSSQSGQQFDANGNPTGKPTGGSIGQSMIDRGLGNTTAFDDANRGAYSDYGNAIGSLGSQLGQTYAGYQNNVGQAYLNQQSQGNAQIAQQGDAQLGFMNSVQVPYPDVNAYTNILYQQGQAAQAAAQQAQQLQIFKMGLGRGGSGGGGGVSTPQMPGVNRGGGVQTGGNAMPGGPTYMGGATTPMIGGSGYGGGGGGGSIDLGGYGSNIGLGGVSGAAAGAGGAAAGGAAGSVIGNSIYDGWGLSDDFWDQ